MIALTIALARVCDGLSRMISSRSGSTITPPPSTRPVVRPTDSSPLAPGSANGLMKISPRASAIRRVLYPPKLVAGPSRSSVVHSVPPSRLVTLDPGSIRTHTSNVVPAGAPGITAASTITTATFGSRSTCFGDFPASGPTSSPARRRASRRSAPASACSEATVMKAFVVSCSACARSSAARITSVALVWPERTA